MSNGKDTIISLIEIIVRPCIKIGQYFPKSFRNFGRYINVKIALSNYATEADFKNVTHVDTSNFALKTNLANLKTEVEN